MTLKNLLLALLVGFAAFWLCPTFANPAPAPNCDNKCRARQYHYETLPQTYRKYETATCELCKGPNRLCVVDSGDTNTDATCTTMAGQEKGNKYWEIASKSKCDFTLELYIQAEQADPTTKTFTVAAIQYCPAP